MEMKEIKDLTNYREGMEKNYVVVLSGTEKIIYEWSKIREGVDRDYIIDYNT